MKLTLAVLAVALAVPVLASAALGSTAAPQPVTESEADDALHFGYALQDEDRLYELDIEVSNAESEAAGLQAEGADQSSIAVALAEVEAAQFRYELEERGRPLALEDCLGLGKAIRTARGYAFARFRCRMTIIGDSRLIITKTEGFTAGDIRDLAAVPRPRKPMARWSERLMEDRLERSGRLTDPAFVRIARENVRSAEEELAGLQAIGANQRSIDAAAARLRSAKRALAGVLKGIKLDSATCDGAGLATMTNGRETFVSFRCRVSSDVGSTLDRAFMVVEAASASKFRVRKVDHLAPL